MDNLRTGVLGTGVGEASNADAKVIAARAPIKVPAETGNVVVFTGNGTRVRLGVEVAFTKARNHRYPTSNAALIKVLRAEGVREVTPQELAQEKAEKLKKSLSKNAKGSEIEALIDAKLEKLKDSFLGGGVSEADFDKFANGILTKLDALETKIENVKKALDMKISRLKDKKE